MKIPIMENSFTYSILPPSGCPLLYDQFKYPSENFLANKVLNSSPDLSLITSFIFPLNKETAVPFLSNTNVSG